MILIMHFKEFFWNRFCEISLLCRSWDYNVVGIPSCCLFVLPTNTNSVLYKKISANWFLFKKVSVALINKVNYKLFSMESGNSNTNPMQNTLRALKQEEAQQTLNHKIMGFLWIIKKLIRDCQFVFVFFFFPSFYFCNFFPILLYEVILSFTSLIVIPFFFFYHFYLCYYFKSIIV